MKMKVIFITAVLSAAVLLRLVGITYGLPDLSHPDEARVILDTLSMGHRMSLLPERPDYALFYRYLLLFLFCLFFLAGKAFGAFKDAYDFAFAFMTDPSGIYLTARLVSVFFGAAIGLVSYFLAKRVFKKEEAGVVALIFTLFEFQLFQHSQWAIYPVAFSLATLPAFYCMFRLPASVATGAFARAGLFVGLAISVQNQGIFLVPSLFVALLLNFLGNRSAYNAGFLLKNWGASFLCLALAALPGNAYWFFIFGKSLAKTLELAGVTQVGFSSVAPYTYSFLSISWWFLQELIRQDEMLGVLMVGGIAYAIYRRRSHDLIFLAFLCTYLWALSSWGFRLLHDMLSLLPVTCIFAARFFVETTSRLIEKKRYYALLAIGIVLPLALDSYGTGLKKTRPDTRQVAAAWIEENIPAASSIACDWQVFSVPLKSEVPFLFRNPVAEKYYRTKMPAALIERYRRYLGTQKTYRLIEAMYATEEAAWPADMPASAIEKARQKYVYRDLYSRFNFKTLSELRKEGAQYLVITSYAWGFFLLDDDPAKENLFNAFVKDTPKKYYRHVDHFIDDGRHGLLYYLAREGRRFYEPLLRNEAAGVTLIKEFSPQGNLGPTIKVFKITDG